MATKIESTEVSQQKKVFVKSEEALDEMEASGQLEPFTDYYTPDESEEDLLTRTEVNTNMLGVPSNDDWVDITWSGVTMYYTAPANGYIVAYFEATSNSPTDPFRGVRIYNVGNKSYPDGSSASVIKGGTCCMLPATIPAGDFEITLPVKKGDYLRIIVQNVTRDALRFIPAEEV